MSLSVQKNLLGHDELITQLFLHQKELNKSAVVSSFLASLTSNTLARRSGLSVCAILQTFPNHKFELRQGQTIGKFSPCAICSNWLEKKNNTEIIEEAFEDIGGLIGFGLLDYVYFAQRSIEGDSAEPSTNDLKVVSEIVTILLQADPADTAKKEILSNIGRIKGFKPNAEQRQALLETLGYCSILESDEHKGLLKRFTNLAVAPTKTHNSDWHYPVDFWTGKDGINREAFKFWFGEYSELKQFWE